MVEVRPAYQSDRTRPDRDRARTGESSRRDARAAVFGQPNRCEQPAQTRGRDRTVDEVNPLISEWDYGDYEGTTTEEIRKAVPNWLVWTHGCPGGETSVDVCERADQAIELALAHMQSRDVVFVGHGHFSRAVVTRWIEQPVYEGIRFAMPAASIAICGFEHGVRQLSALGLTGRPNP